MKWNFPSLYWTCPLLLMGMAVKNQNRMANSVAPDEMAYYEPSYTELNCLHRIWPRGYKKILMLNSAEHEICPVL